jgi:very-short-patch-repair endonuclease
MSSETPDAIVSGADRIAATLGQWRRQLLDTSRISKLINCKFSRGSGGASAGGALALEHPTAQQLWDLLVVQESPANFAWASDLLSENTSEIVEPPPEEAAESSPSATPARANLNPEEIQSCLASPHLKSTDVVTGLFDKRLDSTLKRMSLAAQTSLSEQGINSLFIAFGFLRWFESKDSDIETISPLLLVPVSLAKQHGQAAWSLLPIDDEIAGNYSIAELLRTDFRIDLPEAEDDTLRSAPETLDQYLDLVRAAVGGQPRWGVEAKAALGLFGFQKISMWHDLRRNEGRIIDHPLCRSIAGDADASSPGDARVNDGDGAIAPLSASPGDLDASPADHDLILDCDGSQLAAVTAVKQGSHLILDGPPGTGKSQTIANMIAETLAAGKTVLFVSEKSAALEVVKRRLDKNKLGDFCLECHSHKSNKRLVIEELGRCLNHQPETYPSQEEKLSELDRCRITLNRYVHALHAKRSDLDESAYQMHGRLATLVGAPNTRFDIADPHSVSKTRLQQLEEAVARLVLCEPIIASRGQHPWRGCRPDRISLSFVDDVRHHFPRAAEALEHRRIAATPLIELGFLAEKFSAQQLIQATKSGSTIAAYPFVPEEWIKRGLRASADAYVRLEELASEFRIAMSAADSFDRSALPNAPLEIFADVEQSATELRGIAVELPATVRPAHRHIVGIREHAAELVQSIAALQAAGAALDETLGTPSADALTASTIGAHAKIGRIVLSVGHVPAEWFDSSRRATLKKSLVEAKQAAEFALLARKPLDGRLQPVALAAASIPLGDELLQYESWFRRWGGGWRRAKAAFATLYSTNPPKASRVLLDDAHQLRRYRAAVQSLNAVVDSIDAPNLGWDGSIDFNWTVVIDRLQQFDTIDQSTLELPEFQTHSQRNGNATMLLQNAVQGVERCTAAFDAAINRIFQEVKLSTISDSEQANQYGLSSLSSTISALTARLAATERAFAQLIACLSPAGDPAIEQLSADRDVLQTIRSLHLAASAIAQSLGEQLPPVDAGSLGDFTPQAKLGVWICKLGDHYGGTPPATIVRILGDRAARDKLRAGLKAIDDCQTIELRDSCRFLDDAFPSDVPVSSGLILNRISESERIEWLRERGRDAPRVQEWGNYLGACAALEQCGLSTLRDEVLNGSIAPCDALSAFRARFYKRWLDETYRAEPLLREFDPGAHEQTAHRFRELDRSWISNGFSRIRPALISRCPNPSRLGGAAPNTSEIGVLLRETNKRRRHLPLRKLFAAMPTLLQKLKPCIMMSPLAVSTYFDSCDVRFDLVIFDEASQVRPHDAICAIYRGKQLIVAGDQMQLPPTNFFERLTSEEEESDEEQQNTNDYESILDVCASMGLPRQRLKWHYRSKRESLIAFSNKFFYGGELITFPSVFDVEGSSGVMLNFIADAQRAKKGTVTNALEATRIAEAVIQHARQRPEKSLGVITMNVSQQMLVWDEIRRLQHTASDIESFLSAQNPEPFFVKNLENVQGDERDVIFLGVGFAKDELGKLNHNFGPLNRSGGERRLNVAVTRARESLCVFSSIKAQDIDLARTSAMGASLLKAYLDFAERGAVALAGANSESSDADNDSEFEAQVERALRSHGLDVRRQVGCCGFRIDLALVHPQHKGRYVLGIEADGATYHSSASARDRDRLRQELLESLGWRIIRIWSTDWIRNPQPQVERVLKAFQDALAVAETQSTVPAPPAPTEVVEPTAMPVTVPRDELPSSFRQYSTIDDVPVLTVQQALHQGLTEFGRMEVDDLLLHAARSLGFSRRGAKIYDRLHRNLMELQRAGSIRIIENRVTLVDPANG